MKKFIIMILLFGISYNIWAVDSLKHMVVVTQLQDTMALINKQDINIINKTFYQRDVLDSLHLVNDSLIKNLESIKAKQDSIINSQRIIIANDSLILYQYKIVLEHKNQIIKENQKAIKSQKNQKYIWQSTTGALAIALLVIILI